MLEYVGTFEFLSTAEEVSRTWYLWAVVDDEDEVCAIHIGISSNIHCASGEILVCDCNSELRKHAFALAKEQHANPKPDDYEVIDHIDWRIQ